MVWPLTNVYPCRKIFLTVSPNTRIVIVFTFTSLIQLKNLSQPFPFKTNFHQFPQGPPPYLPGCQCHRLKSRPWQLSVSSHGMMSRERRRQSMQGTEDFSRNSPGSKIRRPCQRSLVESARGPELAAHVRGAPAAAKAKRCGGVEQQP